LLSWHKIVLLFRNQEQPVKKIKSFFTIFKDAVQLFVKYNGLKLSAALSYYTVFSAIPLLIVIISLTGIFFGRQAVEGKVYLEIKELVGSQAATQIQHIIQNIQQSNQGTIGSLIGFVILFISASGVFSEIQDSINYLWSIQAPPKKRILHMLTKKLTSFSLLIGLGFILLVSLIINAIVDVLSEQLKNKFPDSTVKLFNDVNIVLLLFIVTILFILVFKVLPNAVIRWRDAIVGAIFTALLFLIGKFAIGLYLGNSRIGITYGTIASILILMLWVYYSSIILYFGASFTKVYAQAHGRDVESKPPS
jgi:membrane protein